MEDPSGDDREPIDLLAEDFLERRRRGETPALSEYLERYPHLAGEIRDVFPALVLMDDIDPHASDLSQCRAGAGTLGVPPERRQLGDYRLIRQIGQGGMGIVYEAEQISLGRHVALKIFPLHRLSDARYLERFRREARAAGRLHHTNIVPVFGVGECDGLHFYTMQFINGEGLDRVVRDLRRLRGGPASPHADLALPPTSPSGSIAQSLLHGQFAPSGSANEDEAPRPEAATVTQTQEAAPLSGSAANGTSTTTTTSTSRSELTNRSESAYCRGVARLGLQAAEALAYAHRQGILHRDIKPSNLLLDTQGTVWVTDFGLAKAEGTEELTHTGDVVGTLRYMAPERFRGASLPQSDVYGLGLTLYELLTLRPAFADDSRGRLIDRIQREEPPPPRRFDPRIPRDLETVVLRAIAKEPGQRYATADALAEDLRRFLADEPIKARRAGLPERLVRWCRRNPAVAGLLAAVAVTLLSGTVVASFFAFQANENARTAQANEEQALKKQTEAETARHETDMAREESQRNLYLAEMNLAGQSAEGAGGINQINQLLAHWRPTGSLTDRRGWEWYYLRGLGPRPLLTLHKHSAAVQAVSWSPDGRRLASASADATIKVWDADTGREITTLRGHRAEVWSVAWSPDGQRLASVGNDWTLRIWDATTGNPAGIFRGRASWWARVSWSPDGRSLVCTYYDGSIRIWDADGGRETAVLHGASERVLSVVWSPDGRRLASGCSDQTIRIWDVASGEETACLAGAGRALVLSWSPDGRRLVSGGDVVKTWDVDTERALVTFQGHAVSVDAVSWSPDGQQIASAAMDQTVKLWDPVTGQETATLRQHTNWVLGLSWSPDSRRLASASSDRTIKVWDVAAVRSITGQAGRNGSTSQDALTWSPDGRLLAVAGNDNTIHIWDWATRRELAVLPGHTAHITALDWSPDSRRLASASGDKTVRLWDAADGRPVAVLNGHGLAVRDVSWSPDGRRLASAGDDRTLRLWDAETGRSLGAPLRHDPQLTAVRWSPDGRRLAVACAEPTLRLWDADTRQELATLRGHTDLVEAVNWSPNGRWLASSSVDGTIRLWDAETYHELAALHGHAATVTSVSWSPDGRHLASGGVDRLVKLWDVETRRETLTLPGNVNASSVVRWSPDGLRLATASQDQGIRIWDAAPGYRAERSPLLLPELGRRLQRDPDSGADLLLRAEIHARLGNWDQAAADWSTAARRNPSETMTWFQAGWWLAGPFGANVQESSEGEEEPGFLQPQDWRAVTALDNGCLDLDGVALKDKPSAAYALLRVYSPREQPIAALVSSAGPLRFWQNGQLLHRRKPARPLHADNEPVPLTLQAGWNTLLFQVALGAPEDYLVVWLSAETADRVRALAGKGRWDEAEALVTDLRERQPDDAATLLLAGRFFRLYSESLPREGRSDKTDRAARRARECLEKLLALDPNRAAYACELAECLFSQSDHWEVLEPVQLASAGGTTLTALPDGSILASGKNPLPETYTITCRLKRTSIAGIRLELLTDPSLPLDGPGRAGNGNMRLNEFRVTAAPEGNPEKTSPVLLQRAWADFSERGLPVAAAIDGDPATNWGIHPEWGRPHEALFELKEPITTTGGTILTFTLEQRHRAPDWVHNLGRFRLSCTARPQSLNEERWRICLAQHDLSGWTKLGGACYLRGEWSAALTALQKATGAPSGGDDWDRLLLALVHRELGKTDVAEQWANEAFAWMAKHETEEHLEQFAVENLAGWLAQEPRPDTPDTRIGRARIYALRNELDKAVAEATRAVELSPTDSTAWQTRCDTYCRLLKWPEAFADCTRVVALRPDDRDALALRADLAARCGQWAAAANDFRKLAAQDPADAPTPTPWFRQALAQLAAGNVDDYRQTCAGMLERFQDTNDWQSAHFTAWTCALAPNALSDLTPALRLAEKAFAEEPLDPRSHRVLGAVLYRMGRLEESIEHFRAAEAPDPSTRLFSPAYTCSFLAMAHHRLGHAEEARQWLERAAAHADRELHSAGLNREPGMWVRNATLQLLPAEAAAVLRGGARGADERSKSPQ